MSIADPRIIFLYELRPAMADVQLAIDTHHRGEVIAASVLAGARPPRSYENAFAILTAERATYLYKASEHRKDMVSRHRASQRTAQRRQNTPLKRSPRRIDEWDGSPRIPALNAEELSTKHADELRSLLWLAYFMLEARRTFDRKILGFFKYSLPAMHDGKRDFARLQDALRKAMLKWETRLPSQELRDYYEVDQFDPDPAERVARAAFQKLGDAINEVRFGSGRPKSKLIRH